MKKWWIAILGLLVTAGLVYAQTITRRTDRLQPVRGLQAYSNELVVHTPGTSTVTFRGADAAGAANTAYDTTGAGAITIGSADVTAATITTDGSGDAELVLPASSVGFAEQSHITIGASPAATCTAGQIHIDTDQTVDTNCTTTADNSLCLCTAADTWTALENN